ncbi:MAG: NAD(P)-dependent oxidoreductase, partial [Ornithinimicrobium sp.]
MSIVVTGGSGFLGRTLVPTLVRHGHSVVVIDRRPWPASSHVGDVTAITGELSALSDPMRDALGQAEAVVHLAGCPGVRDDAPDVAFRRQRDNVDAARAVLEATPGPTPTVVLSSSSVYGGSAHPSTHRGASHEDDPLRPQGGYALSKVATEEVCRQRSAAGGHALVVRPFTVVGEGQRPDMAVARWAHQARIHGRVTVLGSADRTRDLTDVRDVARSILALLHAERAGTVNLGTGRSRSLAELAEAVCAAVGVSAQHTVLPA